MPITRPTPQDTARVIFGQAPRGLKRWAVVLLCLTPVVLAGYALQQTYFFYTHYGPVAATYRPRPFWALAAFFGLLALVVCLRIRWRRKSRLIIAPSGLNIDLPPKAPLALSWDEVESIQVIAARGLASRPSPRGRIILILRNGQRLHLDDRFPNLLLLARELQRHLYAERLPKMRQQWEAGQTMDFGALQISSHGITHKRHQYPWREVQGLSIRQGALVIELHHRHKPIRIPVHRLKNPDLLLWWLHEEAKR
ncbi:MAG: hypothetical protein GXO56_05085 [Chloroflexi bacterium]|nr:hypothetical protein [Chloroflexota bacterium]